MKMDKNSTRRSFFKQATALSITALPLSALAEGISLDQSSKLKVICVGGHPDDPESGCGGTLAKLSRAGYDVKVLYLTRGEAGIEGKSHREAAAIRTREAEAACKILNVKPEFLGQIDGDTIFNSEWIRKMTDFMEKEQPDIVFTQCRSIHIRITR
jgi:LmbE family N-acetylglucosaminyl deacetylase